MGIFKSMGHSSRKEKKLIESGVAIDFVITGVAINNSVSINGRNPRRLVCEGVLPDGSKACFESDNIKAYVQPEVIGRPIKVYVDPNDYGKYYVDIAYYVEQAKKSSYIC